MSMKTDKEQCPKCDKWLFEREINWIKGDCRFCEGKCN